MKICTKCKLKKKSKEFQKNRSKPDGLQAHCKPCANKQYGKILKCEQCEDTFEINHRNIRKRKNFLCPHCLFKLRQKILSDNNKRNATYKTISTRGYQYIFCHLRKKYIFEHRMIIEKQLGRYLTKLDVVHHIDHNPMNNSKENLFLTDIHGHRRIHKTMENAAWDALKKGYIIFNPDTKSYEAK